MSKIGIVIPVLNNFEGALNALQSVKTSHDWEPVILPQWRENRPLSTAWNMGIEIALDRRGCDYVLVINDDILFAPFTIDNLVEEFQNAPEDVIMMTAINNRGYIDTYLGGPFGTLEHPHVEPNGIFTEHPDFSCFLIDKRAPSLVGKFDHGFDPAYYEDNDYNIRIHKSGLRSCCASSAPYYHYASQTKKTDNFHLLIEKNRELFERKWGAPASDNWDSFYNLPFNNSALSVKSCFPYTNLEDNAIPN